MIDSSPSSSSSSSFSDSGSSSSTSSLSDSGSSSFSDSSSSSSFSDSGSSACSDASSFSSPSSDFGASLSGDWSDFSSSCSSDSTGLTQGDSPSFAGESSDSLFADMNSDANGNGLSHDSYIAAFPTNTWEGFAGTSEAANLWSETAISAPADIPTGQSAVDEGWQTFSSSHQAFGDSVEKQLTDNSYKDPVSSTHEQNSPSAYSPAVDATTPNGHYYSQANATSPNRQEYYTTSPGAPIDEQQDRLQAMPNEYTKPVEQDHYENNTSHENDKRTYAEILRQEYTEIQDRLGRPMGYLGREKDETRIQELEHIEISEQGEVIQQPHSRERLPNGERLLLPDHPVGQGGNNQPITSPEQGDAGQHSQTYGLHGGETHNIPHQDEHTHLPQSIVLPTQEEMQAGASLPWRGHSPSVPSDAITQQQPALHNQQEQGREAQGLAPDSPPQREEWDRLIHLSGPQLQEHLHHMTPTELAQFGQHLVESTYSPQFNNLNSFQRDEMREVTHIVAQHIDQWYQRELVSNLPNIQRESGHMDVNQLRQLDWWMNRAMHSDYLTPADRQSVELVERTVAQQLLNTQLYGNISDYNTPHISEDHGGGHPLTRAELNPSEQVRRDLGNLAYSPLSALTYLAARNFTDDPEVLSRAIETGARAWDMISMANQRRENLEQVENLYLDVRGKRSAPIPSVPEPTGRAAPLPESAPLIPLNEINAAHGRGRNILCGSAAVAYDNTLRGIPTLAVRGSPRSEDELTEMFYPGRSFINLSRRDVEAAIQNAGPGATGIVGAGYSDGSPGGHFFNVLNRDGQLEYHDPEIGRVLNERDLQLYRIETFLRTN